MWGDKPLTDWNEEAFSEKTFAKKMKIQFTPTLIFLDKNATIVLRLDGYQNKTKMKKVLDFVSKKYYKKQSFSNYQRSFETQVNARLKPNTYFESGIKLLARNQQLPAQKFLAVFFEKPNCQTCNYFHQNILSLPATRGLLNNMQRVRFNVNSNEKLITPNNQRTTAKQWYESLKLTYLPAVVFFNKTGKEIIRKDAFFKAYHFQGILSYVNSGAYQNQPSFQRYLENKSNRLRNQGVNVDLWQ
jgi:thioredoxin-related protein